MQLQHLSVAKPLLDRYIQANFNQKFKEHKKMKKHSDHFLPGTRQSSPPKRLSKCSLDYVPGTLESLSRQERMKEKLLANRVRHFLGSDT